MSKDTLTYSGNGQVRVSLGGGKMFKVGKGGTVKRGDIPNDAFDALAIRPDFGGDLDGYRRSIGASAPVVEQTKPAAIADEPTKPATPVVKPTVAKE